MIGVGVRITKVGNFCWRVVEYEENLTVVYRNNTIFVKEIEKCSSDEKLK